MLNIHENLLDELTDAEYFLLSTICRYGKKSCPSNDVLCSKTRWGVNKVQSHKKELISKGFLVSNIRWKELNGKQVRDSNEYTINTKFISKYNGKKDTAQLNSFDVVEIHLHDSEVYEIDVNECEVHENSVGIKVLKVIIIESKELLNKKSIENSFDLEITDLKKENERLKRELEEYSNKKSEQKYPDVFSPKLIEVFEDFIQMRKQLKKPVKIMERQIKSIQKQITKFGEQSVIDAIESSIDNQYLGIFPKVSKEPKEQPQPKEESHNLEAYILQYYREVDLKHMKLDGSFDRWNSQLTENAFKLGNIAKGYKNKSITVLFLFELLFMPLGNRLNGSNDTRKYECFQRIFCKLNDYQQNQGDMREIIKEWSKQQT